MAEFPTNTGVGNQVKIWGVRGSYIFVICAIEITLFILSAILSNMGVPVILVVVLFILCAVLSFTTTNRIYKRFGVHGIMKYSAMKKLPPYIRNRKGVSSLIIKK